MKKYLRFFIILLFVIVVMMPIFIHGYVYPTIGDDAAYHIATIEKMGMGKPIPELLYLGQAIIGYPMSLLKGLVNISTLYLWFSYLVLVFVGLSFYYITLKIVNELSGYFAMWLPVFGFSTVLYQWNAGVVFNILNIVFMLWGIYFCLNWMENKKIGYLASGILLFILSSLFHTTGIYLITLIPTLILVYFVNKKTVIRYAIVMVVFSLTLCVSSLLKISVDPFRQFLDCVTILTLLLSAFIPILLKSMKSKIINIFVTIVSIIVISIPVYHWIVDYNSAITETDLEVIEYVNSLGGDYYSCSPGVAYWVYDVFLNKEYKEGELPYIGRNEPMTNKTTPGAEYYWWDNKPQPDMSKYDNYRRRLFKDGSLEMYVIP